MDNKKLFPLSVLSSLGAFVYILLVVLFLSNAKKIFGQTEDTMFAPIIMLTLFVLSALITSLIILGKPILLYLDGQKKAGITLLLYTTLGLAVILALVILAYMGLR